MIQTLKSTKSVTECRNVPMILLNTHCRIILALSRGPTISTLASSSAIAELTSLESDPAVPHQDCETTKCYLEQKSVPDRKC